MGSCNLRKGTIYGIADRQNSEFEYSPPFYCSAGLSCLRTSHMIVSDYRQEK